MKHALTEFNEAVANWKPERRKGRPQPGVLKGVLRAMMAEPFVIWNSDVQKGWFDEQRLADSSGYSLRHISDAVDDLEEAGWLRQVGRNNYTNAKGNTASRKVYEFHIPEHRNAEPAFMQSLHTDTDQINAEPAFQDAEPAYDMQSLHGEMQSLHTEMQSLPTKTVIYTDIETKNETSTETVGVLEVESVEVLCVEGLELDTDSNPEEDWVEGVEDLKVDGLETEAPTSGSASLTTTPGGLEVIDFSGLVPQVDWSGIGGRYPRAERLESVWCALDKAVTGVYARPTHLIQDCLLPLLDYGFEPADIEAKIRELFVLDPAQAYEAFKAYEHEARVAHRARTEAEAQEEPEDSFWGSNEPASANAW